MFSNRVLKGAGRANTTNDGRLEADAQHREGAPHPAGRQGSHCRKSACASTYS